MLRRHKHNKNIARNSIGKKFKTPQEARSGLMTTDNLSYCSAKGEEGHPGESCLFSNQIAWKTWEAHVTQKWKNMYISIAKHRTTPLVGWFKTESYLAEKRKRWRGFHYQLTKV